MKKRYFWIYVLPVLMLTTTLAFGGLGVRSAIGEQKMQTELAKVDWKMEPVFVLEEHWPQYEESIDVMEVIVKEEKGGVKRWFTSDPVILNDEEVDQRYQEEAAEKTTYWPEATEDGREIMTDENGERVGTVQMAQINSWSDKYVCGIIGGNIYGILDYNGRVLMEADDYNFDWLHGDIFSQRPWNGKGSGTKVFNLITGEVYCELDGDWFVSTNAIGYEAEGDDEKLDREIIYYDKDFKELKRVKNGMIWMGPEEQNRYWQNHVDGQKKLLDKNLQVIAEYDNKLLAFTEFYEGQALLYYKNKMVCIDENLNVIFEKKAHIIPRYADSSRCEKDSIVRGLNVDGFHDGLAVFTLDGCRYGILDKDGNILIEPVFKGIDSLTIMKNHHISVFYEQEFRIGELKAETGGGKDA